MRKCRRKGAKRAETPGRGVMGRSSCPTTALRGWGETTGIRKTGKQHTQSVVIADPAMRGDNFGPALGFRRTRNDSSAPFLATVLLVAPEWAW
jgi:hypothetical protein